MAVSTDLLKAGSMASINDHWQEIRRLFDKAFRSSLHYALATVKEDGSPHITPIGSLFLTEPGKGFYFEMFTTQMPLNFKTDQRVCVLAVRSGLLFWLRSLVFGRFPAPPAVRLIGRAGERRPATDEEVTLFLKGRVGPLRWFKGYRLLWRHLRYYVREISFDDMVPIDLGAMTEGHWS